MHHFAFMTAAFITHNHFEIVNRKYHPQSYTTSLTPTHQSLGRWIYGRKLTVGAGAKDEASMYSSIISFIIL